VISVVVAIGTRKDYNSEFHGPVRSFREVALGLPFGASVSDIISRIGIGI
jgi:hypothetical protein